MKSFEKKLFAIIIGIIATAVHQSWTLEDEYADDDIDLYEFSTLRPFNSLTPEERVLADEARAHIAKTIEKNLIRLLTIASTQNARQPRQDEDDDDVTPNPNVLPQVAQILGAIFSGSLNISRVVDQTFGLVPNVVRNQVGGLVKLLTGSNMTATATATNAAAAGSSTKSPSAPVTTQAAPTEIPTTSAPKPQRTKVRTRSTTTPAPPPVEEPTTLEAEIEVVEVSTTTSKPTAAPAPPAPLEAAPLAPAAIEEIALNLNKLQGNNTSRFRYRIRNRNKSSTTTPRSTSLVEDDEIEKLEDELIRIGKEYEPYMQDRDPRFIAEAFQRVFGRMDFNSTQITKAVPSIFKGARQALVVLDTLGILDANDLLDELGLPNVEAEE